MTNDHQRVLATLDEYAEAYCGKDLERLMAIFVDGDNISLIGTGGDELCAGRQAIALVFARNFKEATATRFQWGWTDVAVHGDAATVAIQLVIHLTINGQAKQVPLRWTVALARIGLDWKWIHRHASSAARAQGAGSAYPVGD